MAGAAEHVVKPGETLWSIARARVAAYPGASVGQVAWGVVRANPEAFAAGPAKLKRGARLLLPSPETVAEASREVAARKVRELYDARNQAAPRALAVQRPAPDPSGDARAEDGAPRIAGVELMPAVGNEERQWLGVSGTGFVRGARLEFFDVAANRALAARIPASVKPDRIEYQARFGDEPSRWRVTVRNPDGKRSQPFEFEAGRNITITLAPAVPAIAEPAAVPASVGFRHSAEAQSLAANAQQRYEQLAALEDRYAGDVDFDYGLGAAAVDTGKFTEAVFPLQRAVATRPKFAGARLELARAYYGVGDNEAARREFNSLRAEQPPPRVEEMIQQYLDAIDRRAVEYQRQMAAFAEISAGHDSNANGATDSQVFLGFNLNDRSRAAASAYYGLNLGGLLSYPLAPGWRTQIDAQLASRQVPDAPFVDANQARAGAALEWRNHAVTVNGTASYAYAELDGAENNTNTAVDLTLGIPFAPTWQLGVGARRAALRFVDALSAQDVDSTLMSLALSTTAGRFQFSGGLTGGVDDAVEPASAYGRTLAGARLSAFMDTGRSRYLFASVAGLQSDYDRPYLGLFERKDTQLSGQVGMDWRDFPLRLCSVKTQAVYVRNSSDILIFDYDRFDVGLALRREFR